MAETGSLSMGSHCDSSRPESRRRAREGSPLKSLRIKNKNLFL